MVSLAVGCGFHVRLCLGTVVACLWAIVRPGQQGKRIAHCEDVQGLGHVG